MLQCYKIKLCEETVVTNFNVIIEDKKFYDLNPRDCGCMACPPGETIGITVRDYTMIHYVFSGKGKVYVGGKTYSVGPEQIFIIPEGVQNKYVADEEDPWTFIWIVFDGNLSGRFASLPTVMDFKSPFFQDLCDVQNVPTMKKEFLAQKLFKLYIELFKNDSRINYIDAIKNFINNNYIYHDISVKQIAASLNLNRSYVSRIFSKEQGMSIQEYIKRVRLFKAKELLYNGTSVQDTAKLVGYLDQSQFSKAFKNFFKESPIFYKKHSHSHSSENIEE